MNVERQLQLTRAEVERNIARGRSKKYPFAVSPEEYASARRRLGQARRTQPLNVDEVDARSGREVSMDSVETGVCVRCGRSHERENRLRLIRPMLELRPEEIAALWPCFYPCYRKGSPSEALLARDLWILRRRP